MKILNIIILFLLLIACANAQEEWELTKEDEGVKIFTRYEAGSDVKAFKAEAVMEGKLSSFVALLKDVKTYPEVFSGNKRAELLKITDTSQVHYMHLSIPWPFKDRECVHKLIFKQHYGTKVVTGTMHAVEGYINDNKKHVRILKAQGYWMFYPVGDNMVEVTYQMHVEPGGNLPAWIINMFLVDSPLDDMKNIRERVKLPQYANEKYEFLVEY